MAEKCDSEDSQMNETDMSRYIERVPLVSEPMGYPRLVGRRISVVDVVLWHKDGRSIAKIAADYDLDEEMVQAALTFYEENREEIDRYIAEGEAFFEAGYQAQLHDPIYLGMKARREVLVLQERPDLYVSDDEPGANGR